MYVEKLKVKFLSTDSTQHSYSYRQFVINEFKKTIPFKAACFTTIDPESLLSTGAVIDKPIEFIHKAILENEYKGEDYNHYSQLVKCATHFTTLHNTTNGELNRSQRYTKILAPAGLGDELRAVLMDKENCWGHLTLYRSADQPAFTQSEQQLIAHLLPTITKKVKELTFLSSYQSNRSYFDSAIMVFSKTFKLLSSNEAALSLLSWLRQQEQLGENILPRPIETLCTKIKVLSSKEETAFNHVSVCILTPNGELLCLYASKLKSNQLSEQYAIISKRAKPFEKLTYTLEYYSLTQREVHIVEQIVNGYTTKQIASHLYISTHTVQDHFKSIFKKMKVNSRRELLLQLRQ